MYDDLAKRSFQGFHGGLQGGFQIKRPLYSLRVAQHFLCPNCFAPTDYVISRNQELKRQRLNTSRKQSYGCTRKIIREKPPERPSVSWVGAYPPCPPCQTSRSPDMTR
eukprot:4772064-Amphidinium_carterae.1